MNELYRRDRKIIWHPFTQEKNNNSVIPIVRAKGSYVYDENGRAYLDLISSWWATLHGHAHEEIALSIYEQARKLEHVMFAGFTHEPAISLCEGLGEIIPSELSKFFFSDNGSTSVEVALKMSYQFWLNRGEKNRSLFICLDGGYHGDTFGAMAVGYSSRYHDVFTDLCFEVKSVPCPYTWYQDPDVESKELHTKQYFESLMEKSGKDVAALIIEPLVQGASGMRMYRSTFIAEIIDKARQYGILIIFDEVMTGFGRTGSDFAMSQIGRVPDLLCLSKGLSGGFLPIALTVTTLQIYEAFLTDDCYGFAHGHTYTANPLACAAANASLKLFRELKTKNAISAINQSHLNQIDSLRNFYSIKNIRVTGTIMAFELKKRPKEDIKRLFVEAGLIIRPLGSTLYIMPPYSISEQELNDAYKKITNIIKHLEYSLD